MISAATDNVLLVSLAVIGVIIACTLFCSAADMIRRKFMVEKPVNKILYATERIAMGDFSVKLELEHDYNKYDEYDLIFDNINTMTAELSRNEILKNDFISNVSHEIKTPLAVMQNYAKTFDNN
jgi:signal transduction histidine kinase